MGRKSRSDSTSRQVQASQAPDLTTAIAPRDVAGCEYLNPYGLSCYDQLFRARAEWALADLLLICQAALTLQTIAELQAAITLPGTLVADGKIHPALTAITKQRTVLQALLRDAGIRQKDGIDKRQPQAAPALHGNTSPNSPTAQPLASDEAGAPDWDSLRLQ